jgi:hypothetical protein
MKGRELALACQALVELIQPLEEHYEQEPEP